MKCFIKMFAILAIFSLSYSFAIKKRVVFAGGPAGGTFQIVANSIQVYSPIKKLKRFNIKARSSAGSTENLRLVNKGQTHLGTVYSGHIYLGREGKLKGDKKKYQNVLAVNFLYGAPAQLVVKKNSGIKNVKDLIGKKVAVGNAGSGAFANCELFFGHMGIWDKIKRNAMGYNDAAQAFGNNQLDAFWLFTAYPSGAVILAAQNNEIDLINVGKDAEQSDFYKTYPYFTKIEIPSGVYNKVDYSTPSFQDSAILVAHKETPKELVYQMLKIIYSDQGLRYMHGQKKTFKTMSVQSGLEGIVTPLHPGAKKFWKEKGMID